MGKKFGVIIDDKLANSVVEIATLNKVSPSKVVGLIVENQLSYFLKIGRYPIFKNTVVFDFSDPLPDKDFEEQKKIASFNCYDDLGDDD